MSLRKPPQAKAPAKPQNFQWDAPSDVLARWAEQPLAAADDGDTVINMFDVIGYDWWDGGGVTAKWVNDQLRAANGRPVTVNINSPGGDMFEGIAIYNLLANYPAQVTVNVVSLAASAASIIAMAGDEVRMATGSFLMIHNCWVVVIGNQNDLRAAADLCTTFDAALADIYEERVSIKRDEIVAMMNAETFISPKDAIAKGFADAMMDAAEVEAKASNKIDGTIVARRRVEAALARADVSRSDRRQMIAALGAPRDASTQPDAQRDASVITGLHSLLSTMTGS